MIAVWIVGLGAGVVVASLASRRAVFAALAAGEASAIPPALIGVSVMAIGTDLPEIANSIVAASTGHGDVNIGDSAGSAMTQVTLVLALLCLLIPPVQAERRTVALIGGLGAGALVVDAILVRDGLVSRVDGLLLIAAWVVSLALIENVRPRSPDPPSHAHRRALPHAGRALMWLAVVAVAATVVVRSFVALTEAIGVPELVASAVVLALGTSLPELVVDWTALRQGAAALAIGDLFGSSLVDATLALGSGPAIRATVVSSGAVTTCLITGAAVAMAAMITASQPTHRRGTGAALLAVYAVGTLALITLTS